MTSSFSSKSPLPIENYVLNTENNNVWSPLCSYKNFVCYSKQDGALEVSNGVIGAKLVTGCYETIKR